MSCKRVQKIAERVFALICATIALVFCLNCPQAFAAPYNASSGISLGVTEFAAQNPSRESLGDYSGNKAMGSVGVDVMGYLYPPEHSQEVQPSLDLRMDYRHMANEVETRAQGLGFAVVSPGKTGLYFELPQAYIDAPIPRVSAVHVSGGRKLEAWNALDDRWQLGIWQPRYRWDYLQPETVGLTGLFVETKTQYVQTVLFGSVLYVPERGIPVSTTDGHFVSESPWFMSPPSNLIWQNKNVPINYTLQVPPITDIVAQWSGGAMIRFGEEKSGPWISGAFAYQPINQLLLAYNGALNVDTNVVDAAIHPRVSHHYLASLDTGVRTRSVDFTLSTLTDIPSDDQVPYGWTSQQVTRSVAVSPSVDYRFANSIVSHGKIGASWLRQFGGNASDVSTGGASSLSAGGGTSFEDRYPYQNAVLLDGSSGIPFARSMGGWATHLTASSRVIYDVGHQGTILSGDLKYAQASWSVDLGADFLASQGTDSTSTVTPSDFIGKYRANDRIRGGISYVF